MEVSKRLLRIQRLCNLKIRKQEIKDEIHSIELIHCELWERKLGVDKLVRLHKELYQIEMDIMNL